ncbi:MAG: RNA polymerase sigma factor [Planctomycetaceae bacterium]
MSPRSGMRRDDDGPLVRRAVDGCVDSFAALLARHQVPVAHFVRQTLGGCGADVDDVVQEVFLRVHSRLADYDHRWAFSTWLFTIARRCCLNHARTERRRRRRDVTAVRPEATSADRDPQAVALVEDAATSLWSAARLVLTERQFSALWLRYAEDLPVEEVAAVLECPVGTAKTLLFRARIRLASVVPAGWTAEGAR